MPIMKEKDLSVNVLCNQVFESILGKRMQLNSLHNISAVLGLNVRFIDELLG